MQMTVFDRFRADQRGAVALMFAILLVPLIGTAGALIDYSRLNDVRAKLTSALDAGVLAVGTQTNMSNAKAYEIVNDWVAAQMGDEYSGYWHLDSVTLNNDDTIVASASGAVETTLARVIGYDEMQISVTSEAIRSLGKVEIALVLDNTGSMRGTKLRKLKNAAKTLIESLEDATDDPEDLKIALVPFSQTVNVGKAYKNASWIDTRGASSIHDDIFTKDNGSTYLGTNRFELFNEMNVAWGGCIESRPYPYDVTEAPPTRAKPDTLYVPYFAPDEPDPRRRSSRSGGYNNNYLADIRSDRYWKGKQGNPEKYKPFRKSGTTRAFGYQYGPNSGCEMEPIQRLTTSIRKATNAVNDMVAVGNTHINVGLQWGWHALSPNAPFGDGAEYDDGEWNKVVVLLTDGNNENAAGNQEDESYYSGYGYIWQNRFGTTSSRTSRRTAALDDRLEELCNNMKKDDVGIVIYTVRVEVRGGSSSVLRNCASQPDNFKEVANVADLGDAFAEIGGSIQKLRLTK
jgi:Flp pilus assembly protein TadG